jgi:lysophospholipase L1-like esterase
MGEAQLSAKTMKLFLDLILLILVVIFSSSLIFVIIALDVIITLQKTMRQRADFFNLHPTEPGDIVFLGDSITEFGEWDELFPRMPVKNRGIAGDTTRGVLDRLDVIITGSPSAVFILIGTNDLPWYMRISNQRTLKTYEEILHRFKVESPATQVFIESILPRHSRFARRIGFLNAELKKLAEKYQYTYIDLFPLFSDQNGGILAEYSNDNIHLMGSGYTKWGNYLLPYLKK